MKTIVIHCFDKGSARTMTNTLRIDGRTKEEIKEEADAFFAEVGQVFFKYHYEVDDQMSEFTDEEEAILDELELSCS